MNPIAILGIAAGVGAGLAIAARKRNQAETWVRDYWRRVDAGEDPTTVLVSMLGADIRLPGNFLQSRAAYIVARGRIHGRGIVLDDPYQGRPDPHWGKDISADRGTPVYAAKTGIVTYAENRQRSGMGRMVWLSHLDVPNESTLYAHLDGFNCGLGQLLEGGDVLGFVGNSCSSPDERMPAWCADMGVHLHFEVHRSTIPRMGERLRDDPVAGRREVFEPETWLADNGIALVGEVQV